jgi:carbonic anhydrase/acetyltransferase-like protein (isoleucine patch superfamily)
MSSVLKFNNNFPSIYTGVYLAPGSKIIGKVSIGKRSSVWFNTVIRGDIKQITIGSLCNIQDNSTLHVADKHEIIIGDGVTIGHNCIIHGAKIGRNCLIGIGSVLLNGVRLGREVMVAAGSLIPENTHIPSGKLVMGRPAKVVRNLTLKEIRMIKALAEKYYKVAKKYSYN